MKPTVKFKYVRFAVLAALVGVPFMSQAQAPQTGIRGGANLSNLFVNDANNESARFGFHAGLYTQIPIKYNFYLQPEVQYSTRGAEAERGNIPASGTYGINLNYLDVPVLGTFKLGSDAEVSVGPYASYLLNASSSYEGDAVEFSTQLDKDNFRNFDFGLTAGFALIFGRVNVGTRYSFGFIQLAESPAAEAVLGNATNATGQVTVGFNLAGGEGN